MQPFGYFVHHQGRGHAVRCAAIARALPAERPLVVFCARDDIFPDLPGSGTIVRIPSLFEPTGREPPALSGAATPETLHCAPLGWPGIRAATAAIVSWFGEADPALMICDVSAEIAQLSRICSVPHVTVLQHGNRSDAGHRAAYDGAVGILAPFGAALAQPEWDEAMRARICFAGGLGLDAPAPDPIIARRRLGIGPEERIALVVSGEGGSGWSSAPLGVAARSRPDLRWITIGRVQRDWHATEPANLDHRGWVDNPLDFVAAADLIVSSTGNTTCQQVLAAARPWLAVPEWRYFDEQHRKAEALVAAGAATVRPHLPSSADAWRQAIDETTSRHEPERQLRLLDDDPAAKAAAWLEALADRLWTPPPAGTGPMNNSTSKADPR